MISESKVPQPNLSDSSIITAFQFTDTTHTRESWQSRCNYADYTERAKQTLLNNFLSSLSKVIQCLDNQAHVTGFIIYMTKLQQSYWLKGVNGNLLIVFRIIATRNNSHYIFPRARLMNLCNLCLLPTFVAFKPTE